MKQWRVHNLSVSAYICTIHTHTLTDTHTDTLRSSPDAWAGFYTTACLLCFDCAPPCRGSAGPIVSYWTHWRHPRTYSRTFQGHPRTKTLPNTDMKSLINNHLSARWFARLSHVPSLTSFLFYSTLTEPVCCRVFQVSVLDFVSPANTNIDAQIPPTQTSSLALSCALSFASSSLKNICTLDKGDKPQNVKTNLNVASASGSVATICWWSIRWWENCKVYWQDDIT